MKRATATAVFAAAAIIAGLFALAQTDAGRIVLGGWSFTKSVAVNDGYYFRLKVSLAYKDDPQDFDIVVGCNVRVTTYKDNSNTYEAGLVPTVFGRRMSDGTGLVIRPPDACRGQTTANGKVPKEFIPLIVVYDDASTLAFGTAYATEDAYHNPLSVLKFTQATIEAATRADFDAFRARETNIVTPQMYFADSQPELDRRNLDRPKIMFGGECHAYARFRLTDAAKTVAQQLWPASQPQYWRPSTDGRIKIRDAWPKGMMLSDREGASLQSRAELFASFADPADKGVAMLSGSHPLLSPARVPATIYPDIGGWAELPWPTNPSAAAERIQSSGPRVSSNVDFREGETRGFAYCYVGPEWYPTRSTKAGEKPRQLLRRYQSMPGINLVDGAAVTEDWQGPAAVILERDQFLFSVIKFYLDSTRGDV